MFFTGFHKIASVGIVIETKHLYNGHRLELLTLDMKLSYSSEVLTQSVMLFVPLGSLTLSYDPMYLLCIYKLWFYTNNVLKQEDPETNGFKASVSIYVLLNIMNELMLDQIYLNFTGFESFLLLIGFDMIYI